MSLMDCEGLYLYRIGKAKLADSERTVTDQPVPMPRQWDFGFNYCSRPWLQRVNIKKKQDTWHLDYAARDTASRLTSSSNVVPGTPRPLELR